jgi:hypothetical protein
MAEWQPMKTAPKDGSWILAASSSGEWARISWGRNRSGDLVWCSPGYWWTEGDRKFSHWMPLPDSPPALAG